MTVYIGMLQAVLDQWQTTRTNLHETIPTTGLCDRVMVSTQPYPPPKGCACFSDEAGLDWCERCSACKAAEERYVADLGIRQAVDKLYATVKSRLEKHEVRPDAVESWLVEMLEELGNLSAGLGVGFGAYDHGPSESGGQACGCRLGICRDRALG
jgi:hypothetical protein